MKKYLSIILLFLVSIPVQSNEFTETFALAEQGDVEAQISLGRMYAIGEVVPKNATTAVTWFTKAAK